MYTYVCVCECVCVCVSMSKCGTLLRYVLHVYVTYTYMYTHTYIYVYMCVCVCACLCVCVCVCVHTWRQVETTHGLFVTHFTHAQQVWDTFYASRPGGGGRGGERDTVLFASRPAAGAAFIHLSDVMR
jgi:hypothetical protein